MDAVTLFRRILSIAHASALLRATRHARRPQGAGTVPSFSRTSPTAPKRVPYDDAAEVLPVVQILGQYLAAAQ